MIEIKDVHAHVDGQEILKGISLNIKPGEILTFYKDKTITCEVYDERQVKFRDKITSLSTSALIVLNEMGYESTSVQGAMCWCYKEKSLLDLRNERD